MQKAAKAIEKRLERLEKEEKARETPPIKMNLPHTDTFKDRIIIRVQDVEGKIDNRVLWESTCFHVRGVERVKMRLQRYSNPIHHMD